MNCSYEHIHTGKAVVGVFLAGITLGEEGVIHYRNGFYMAVGVKWAGHGFRDFLRGY